MKRGGTSFPMRADAAGKEETNEEEEEEEEREKGRYLGGHPVDFLQIALKDRLLFLLRESKRRKR